MNVPFITVPLVPFCLENKLSSLYLQNILCLKEFYPSNLLACSFLSWWMKITSFGHKPKRILKKNNMISGWQFWDIFPGLVCAEYCLLISFWSLWLFPFLVLPQTCLNFSAEPPLNNSPPQTTSQQRLLFVTNSWKLAPHHCHRHHHHFCHHLFVPGVNISTYPDFV